ncbi:uncharacterized protein G6M90_00g096220 [Metarhizium brunneum]|uniref:Pectate lyase superfamily protein domain-containing protein n=1 Tax=Metarhizium brunneum TaxID=500148 RepID=A0A7D5YVU2_9HYPO|nr:hypothetical protein G6M90_00g096220 [Metarhizium brunneum]
MDDTAALQTALHSSQGKILFGAAGSYILTSTFTIDPGNTTVGEIWSQLVASVFYFEDDDNPKVMIMIMASEV